MKIEDIKDNDVLINELRHEFDIDSILKTDSSGIKKDIKGYLFDKIIDFQIGNHKNITNDFFNLIKENIYIFQGTHFEENSKKLYKSLFEKDCKYSYVHAYGKNGKSTFLELFVNEHDSDFDWYIFDFKSPTTDDHPIQDLLVNKCIEIFGEIYIDRIDYKSSIYYLHKLKQDLQSNIGQYKKKDEIRIFLKNFSNWFERIVEFLEKCDNAKKPKHFFLENCNRELRTIIKEEKTSSKEFFSLLILSIIQCLSNGSKNLVVLDNLDDIYTNTAELLGSDIMPHVHRTLESLYNLSEEIIESKYNIKQKLNSTNFVFSLRTANYVSLLTQLKINGASDFERKEHLDSAPVFVITSIKNSDKIFRKRIDFYDLLSELFSFERHMKRDSLLHMINSFNENDNDFSHILRLWNGNRFAFYRSFNAINFEDKNTSLILSQNVKHQLTRAALVHSTVKQLLFEDSLDSNSTLASAIHYFVNSHPDDNSKQRCNLLRLILSQIKNNQKSKLITTPNDVFHYGMTFLSLLSKFDEIKDSEGAYLYSKEDFLTLFEKLFHENIDSWSHFLTCVEPKKLEYTDKEYIVRKYSFTNEINQWFDTESKSKLHQNPTLKITRFYANSNSYTFLVFFKRHFEYYNSIHPGNNKPLYSNINFSHYKKQLKREFYYYDDDGNIQKKKIRSSKFKVSTTAKLKCVYTMAEESSLQTMNFYKNNISKIHSPINYCFESGFALKNTFYFTDLISKHILYIENIRQAIRDDILDYQYLDNFDSKNKLKALNFWFLNYTQKYFNLYDECQEIVDAELIKHKETFSEDSLYKRTNHAILELKKLSNNIYDKLEDDETNIER